MSNEVKIIAGVSIVTLILVVGAAFLFGGSSSSSQSTKPISNINALVHNDSHIINAHSKVTLVEFGDFQCPACGAEYPIITQLLQDYKGKINFVFRNFPLPQHQNAQPAAEAAEAAGTQGKYFEMYNMLYNNQGKWGESANAMDYFIQYAQVLHLDINKFKSEVTNKKYTNKIQQDLNDGYAVGINATPTFYLNGVQIQGVLQYNDFKSKIDQTFKNSS
ncbi:MAG TPA: thioredoxin domain-containing protein [Candidatus Sulfotelmatobacter sp.]|jgi:protein-disulfide isomerase|nr:thioredoxin domain-containing protein [Candidatus Sulfotelmatobacter sp.]